MLLKRCHYSHAGDAELLLLIKQSDATAFEELYKRYWPVLVNAAYKRLSSKEKAEDIVQNIFTDLYRRRTVVEITTCLSAYLHQALRFKVLNEYRAELTRAKHQKNLFFSHNCKIDFSEELDAKELELKLNMALNELPQKCKQVFLLSRNGNLSNKDISAHVNITVSTVEKHISKALKTLRCQL